ncbi:MAG: helix-turn-helix domain-containing protein [Acutalibacteraceae bacterium]
MNDAFPRIITLLRKERGLSQKKAAEELQVSQALLSHYEKGIRECGLEFVVKVANFYNVSCDYLLGRSPNRSGATITIDDLPEDTESKGKRKTGIIATLNKKLIMNSIHVIYGILQECNNHALTEEVSSFLSTSIYKIFRLLYSANPKNPSGTLCRTLQKTFWSCQCFYGTIRSKCGLSHQRRSCRGFGAA